MIDNDRKRPKYETTYHPLDKFDSEEWDKFDIQTPEPPEPTEDANKLWKVKSIDQPTYQYRGSNLMTISCSVTFPGKLTYYSKAK